MYFLSPNISADTFLHVSCFCTTIEGFSYTEFDCAVRSALLAGIQECRLLFFFLIRYYCFEGSMPEASEHGLPVIL